MTIDCESCGACCAAFRVSFYWAETDAHPSGTVPIDMVTRIHPIFVAMRGTETVPPRCLALEGEIGRRVRCTIYPLRSSTCRVLRAGDERCRAARRQHGLPPCDEAGKR